MNQITEAHERGYLRSVIFFSLPVLAFFVVFQVYPPIQNIWLAFTDSNGQATLNNFYQTISAGFWQSTRITFEFAIFSVMIEMFIGFLFALMLNQKFRGRKFVRTIFLIPWALPTAIMAVGWKFLLQNTYGPIPWILYWLHLTPSVPYFLVQPNLVMVSIIMADVWKTVPFCALLLLAGLQAIPEELYEAMDVDGANWWTKLTRLTLPLMVPAIIVTLMFRFLQAFGVFDLIWVLTQGGPGNASMALSPLMYQETFGWVEPNVGASTAVLTMFYMIGLIIIIWTTRVYIGRRYAQ